MRFRKHFLALGFWKSGHGFARISTDQNFEKENPKQTRVHPQESVADSFSPATSAEGRCANMAWVTSSHRDIVSVLHR
jgi:hypothetical protein